MLPLFLLHFLLSLVYQSSRARRLSSDDVDGVGRLPILNDTSYRDILCEIGGMFAIANGIDDIHKGPWIGFQSWRAAGKRVCIFTAILIHIIIKLSPLHLLSSS